MVWRIDHDEARRLLSELVAVDSVNPSLVPGGAGESAAAAYILAHLRRLGLPARLDPVVEGRSNVVGILPAGAARPGDQPGNPFTAGHGLMLNGHLDTVGTAGMTIEPLRATFDGDRVYGRGTLDMKGGLVMGLLAMAAVHRARIPLRRSVILTGVVDEEYASLGTEDVARRYQAEGAVVLEPSGLSLTIAHKGFAWLTVEVEGRAAHGSDHGHGIDAITQMGRFLVEAAGLDRSFRASRAPHPLVGHGSLHASLIEGGRELSTYPDRCRARFERRTLPGEDPAVALGEFESICARLTAADPSFRARVSLDFVRQGYQISREHPLVATLAGSLADIAGTAADYTGLSGWLDSALLAEAGIPTVIFGPSGDGAHAAEEFVSFDSIITGAAVLAEAIIRLCG